MTVECSCSNILAMLLHFVTLWPLTVWPWASIVYLCAKFGDFSFSRFGFIVRTDRISDRRITEADDRYTHTRQLPSACVMSTTTAYDRPAGVNPCLLTYADRCQQRIKLPCHWMSSCHSISPKSNSLTTIVLAHLTPIEAVSSHCHGHTTRYIIQAAYPNDYFQFLASVV